LHNFVKIVERFINTMIFDLVARVVVGSDFVSSGGLTDTGAAAGELRGFFVFFNLPEFVTEEIKGNFAVLLLITFGTNVESQPSGVVN